jgi:16S rRNA (cytidine1402-2'-O)-methyltransferase
VARNEKQFEEVRRGTVSELRAYYKDKAPRGEIVVVLERAAIRAPSDDTVRERVRALRAGGMSSRDTASMVAEELGVPKRLAYRLAQESGVEESSE